MQQTYVQILAEKRERERKMLPAERAFAPTVERMIQEIATMDNTTATVIRSKMEAGIKDSWKGGILKKTKLFKKMPSLEEYMFKMTMFCQFALGEVNYGE